MDFKTSRSFTQFTLLKAFSLSTKHTYTSCSWSIRLSLTSLTTAIASLVPTPSLKLKLVDTKERLYLRLHSTCQQAKNNLRCMHLESKTLVKGVDIFSKNFLCFACCLNVLILQGIFGVDILHFVFF